MGITVYSDIFVKKGAGYIGGNPSVEPSFAGVTAEVYDTAALMDQELYLYKLGVLACRRHIYNQLADLPVS